MRWAIVAVTLLLGSACQREPFATHPGEVEADGGSTVTPTGAIQLAAPTVTVPSGDELMDCFFLAAPVGGVWVGALEARAGIGVESVTLYRPGARRALWGAPGDIVHGGECWK